MEIGSELKNGRHSFFDGGLFSFIGWSILGVLITVFTLGLYVWFMVGK
ncbi:hypothetical protein IEO_02078 [Bacillus wiedmannii]|nr:hypothetical protein IEO_02078 [Bacillus wiedmannii]